MIKSWSLINLLILYSLEYKVVTLEGMVSERYLNLFKFRSKIVTLAPKPAAILAACIPTMPPPKTITFAGSTPGTPPNKIPLPFEGFSKYFAPS